MSIKALDTIIEKPKIDTNEDMILECALDIGEFMLRSGAEILRVEDTIIRICTSYGGGIVDVFTILSLIIVSWHTPTGKNITQTRRIYSYANDLNKLEDLNALSRYICENKPSCEEIKQKIKEIVCIDKVCGKNKVSKSQLTGFMLTAGGFTIFFGGNIRDAISAAMAGMVLYMWDYFFAKQSRNRVVYSFISSIVAGVICLLTVYLGIGVNIDKVMIGSIMLLIPGVNTMNSLRDMICGDIITGILRLAEALMMAVAIAAGFGIAIMVFGGY